MQADILANIAHIDARAWNRLAGDDWPFLKHEFLLAAEETGCVATATGWSPCHIVIRKRGTPCAAMPLYQKTDSWGEFVFDWAWAEAYRRAGLRYYPKLVSAVPFTPAPSKRLLTGNSADPELAAHLVEAALDLAKERECSSLHVLFPTEEELPVLERAGLRLRKDCQFHWHNKGYRSFDEFLETFSSRKRKKARRDRRRVHEQGITFRWLAGGDTDRKLWKDVYRMISHTFLLRGSLPYLDYDFFTDMAARLPDSLLVILAEQRGRAVAAAVFYRGRDSLYGRYWGSEAHYDALHFEACYYQGIEYCIAHGIGRFEPGTQGEHKVSRGFVPVSTWSAHWLERPEFLAAVGHYLDEEQRYVERYMDAVAGHSPYRRADGPAGHGGGTGTTCGAAGTAADNR